MDIKKKTLITNDWENQLIILDEVHHLISHDIEIPLEERKKIKKNNFLKKEFFKSYDEINSFLSKIQYKKLLLLTATPMRNSPSEISPLLNLVMKKEEQFPIGNNFIEKYFEKNKDSIIKIPRLTWKPNQQNQFENEIKGFISVIKQNPDVKIEFIGKIQSPMDSFKLHINTMSDFQSECYQNAFLSDSKNKKKEDESSFYSQAQQTSLFVFPNNTFGTNGSNQFLSEKNHFNKLFYSMTSLKRFTAKSLNKYNKEDLETLEYNLNIVKKYSTTYYNIINQILLNRKKKIYIYSDKINGSGICICIQLLIDFFGFELLTKPNTYNKTELPRIIYLHDTQCNGVNTNVLDLKNEFNDPQNIDGKYIQVIFGTDKTREGISLMHIQQIHICSGDWNFGKIFQAIGRGIRLKSHSGLPKDTKVEIFLHCAIPINITSNIKLFENNNKNIALSIDFYRYYRSEAKDKNIKLIEYSLLKSAVDCEIFKKQNSRDKFENYSSDCFYKQCFYECNGIFDKNAPIDISTYNLYYIENYFKETIQSIQKLFYKNTLWSLQDIIQQLPHYTKKQIIDTLLIMIDIPIKIKYFDGRVMFLNYSNDTFYINENRIQIPHNIKNQLWISDYSAYPAFNISNNFNTILEKLQNQNISKLCQNLHKYHNKDPKQALKIFNMFSKNVKTHIFTQIAMKKNGNELYQWIREQVLKNILYIDNNGDYILKQDNAIFKFDQTQQKWIKTQNIKLNDSENTIDHNSSDFIDKMITKNKYKIYGFYENGKFKIRDVSEFDSFKDLKSATKGKDGMSYEIYEIVYFIHLINPQLPSDDCLNQEQIEYRNKLQTISIKNLIVRLINQTNDATFQKILKLLKKTEQTISKNELIFFILFCAAFKKKPLFEFLKNLMKNTNLIVLPPSKKINNITKIPKKRGRKPKNIFIPKPPSDKSSHKSLSSTHSDTTPLSVYFDQTPPLQQPPPLIIPPQYQQKLKNIRLRLFQLNISISDKNILQFIQARPNDNENDVVNHIIQVSDLGF
jgi:hypothetical protein